MNVGRQGLAVLATSLFAVVSCGPKGSQSTAIIIHIETKEPSHADLCFLKMAWLGGKEGPIFENSGPIRIPESGCLPTNGAQLSDVFIQSDDLAPVGTRTRRAVVWSSEKTDPDIECQFIRYWGTLKDNMMMINFSPGDWIGVFIDVVRGKPDDVDGDCIPNTIDMCQLFDDKVGCAAP